MISSLPVCLSFCLTLSLCVSVFLSHSVSLFLSLPVSPCLSLSLSLFLLCKIKVSQVRHRDLHILVCLKISFAFKVRCYVFPRTCAFFKLAKKNFIDHIQRLYFVLFCFKKPHYDYVSSFSSSISLSFIAQSKIINCLNKLK